MFKIIKDGLCIGYAAQPNYIKQLRSGAFCLCEEDEAAGVAFQATPYNLFGVELEPMKDTDGNLLPTVILEETDAGSLQTAAEDNTTALQLMLAEMYEASLSQ